MSLPESDGISEVLDDGLRFGLTVAGRLAETRIREREHQLRAAAVRDEQAERETQARIHAERVAARAELAAVYRDQWWEQAQPADIERVWQTASQWRDLDRDAARAANQIRTQLRERYHIDVDKLGSGGAGQAGDDATAHADQNSAQTRHQQTEAAAVNRLATRLDAATLTAAGVAPDAIKARELADLSQAYPPQQALADNPRQAPSAHHEPSAPTRRPIRRQERGR